MMGLNPGYLLTSFRLYEGITYFEFMMIILRLLHVDKIKKVLKFFFLARFSLNSDFFEKLLSFQLFSFKGLAFVEEFTVDEPLDNEEEDEQNVIVDEPLDSDLEQDEENVIVDEPCDNDLEQDQDHEEEYYDLDQDNDNENEKIGVKEDQDDFEDCEENVIEVNHHESEFEVIT